MSAASRRQRRRLAIWLDAGIALTLLIAVSFNVARAIVGEEDTWVVQQPVLVLRLVVGTLFVLFVIARLVLWVVSRSWGGRDHLRSGPRDDQARTEPREKHRPVGSTDAGSSRPERPCR